MSVRCSDGAIVNDSALQPIAAKNGFTLYLQFKHRYARGTIKTVRHYEIRYTGTEVYAAASFYRGGWTTKKDALTALKGYAHDPGLHVELKPHMRLLDGGQAWRRVS